MFIFGPGSEGGRREGQTVLWMGRKTRHSEEVPVRLDLGCIDLMGGGWGGEDYLKRELAFLGGGFLLVQPLAGSEPRCSLLQL